MSGSLRKEIRQAKPFRSLEEEVFLSLQRTARLLQDPWAVFLKSRQGLTLSQYNVLRVLRGARPSGLTCGEISDRLVTKDPDVTRLVDRMAKRGLVKRERSQDDRRVVRVVIASEGLAILSRLDAAADAMPKKLLGPLGRTRLRDLRDLLEAARALKGRFP